MLRRHSQNAECSLAIFGAAHFFVCVPGGFAADFVGFGLWQFRVCVFAEENGAANSRCELADLCAISSSFLCSFVFGSNNLETIPISVDLSFTLKQI